MSVIHITDNSSKIIDAKTNAIVRGLEAAGMVAETYAKQDCPVDTGRLKNSIANDNDGEKTVVIGTNVSYAMYQELGTNRIAGKHFLRNAASDHSTEYKQLIKDSLQNA